MIYIYKRKIQMLLLEYDEMGGYNAVGCEICFENLTEILKF